MSMAKKKDNGFEDAPARKSDALSASYVGPRTREPTQSGIKLSSAARPARHEPPQQKTSGVEDVDWWAESTLNATFDASNVIAIEDPLDPSYGDRVTPVFLESITPVFPESKVREVMALADAYERESARAMLAAKPAVAPPPPAPPIAPIPVVQVAQAAAVANPTPRARPVAPPLELRSPAPPKVVDDFVRPRSFVAPPGAGVLASFDRVLGGAPIFDPEAPEDLLHTASFTSKGLDLQVVMWVAMGLVVLLVTATMLTVG